MLLLLLLLLGDPPLFDAHPAKRGVRTWRQGRGWCGVSAKPWP